MIPACEGSNPSSPAKKIKASIAQAVEAFVFPALVRRLSGSVSRVLKQKKRLFRRFFAVLAGAVRFELTEGSLLRQFSRLLV